MSIFEAENPHKANIMKTLQWYRQLGLIESFRDMKYRDQKMLKVEIIFRHNGKNLQVGRVIDLTTIPENTKWDRVISGTISARKKGEDAEYRMFLLMLEWKRKRKYGIHEVYRSSEHADNNKKSDLVAVVERMVYSVETKEYKSMRTIVHIQVKSSEGYQEKHKKKYPWQPSIVVNSSKTDDMLGDNFETISDSWVLVVEMNLLISLLRPSNRQIFVRINEMKNEILDKLHL